MNLPNPGYHVRKVDWRKDMFCLKHFMGMGQDLLLHTITIFWGINVHYQGF